MMAAIGRSGTVARPRYWASRTGVARFVEWLRKHGGPASPAKPALVLTKTWIATRKQAPVAPRAPAPAPTAALHARQCIPYDTRFRRIAHAIGSMDSRQRGRYALQAGQAGSAQRCKIAEALPPSIAGPGDPQSAFHARYHARDERPIDPDQRRRPHGPVILNLLSASVRARVLGGGW